MNSDDKNLNEQLMLCLGEQNISDKMIAIVEKQRINDQDIQNIDRDDVEHLFKNEYGFTFADRKRFWSAIQHLQIMRHSDMKDEQEIIDSPVSCLTCDESHFDHSCSSKEILEQIYDFADEEYEKNESKEESAHISSTQTTRQMDIFDMFDHQKSIDDNNDDHQSNASSYISEFSFSSDYVFTYPSILPSFSANIIQALQTNTIHKQWAAFINELARWVMSIKPCLREQHEYRAIGQTLYEKYPSIGTAGPKPWSFLCRSLSQRIRTERWQRRKTFAANKRKESTRNKTDRMVKHLQTEMLL